jgi:hypothetical protein
MPREAEKSTAVSSITTWVMVGGPPAYCCRARYQSIAQHQTEHPIELRKI